MLTLDELKKWLQRGLTRLDKLLLVLATQDKPQQVADIVAVAESVGFREPKSWNISTILSGSKGLAVRTTGWELTETGKLHLRHLGVATISPAAMQVAVDLRKHLANITDHQTRDFVEEAIKCHEAGLYRSAIVMGWLGAMDVLHKHVHAHHLTAFNAEALRVDSRWKAAVTTDDLGAMKESNFLDRCENISILGSNVKKELKGCLDIRNGCGHPNSLRVSANKSAAHLETLLLNVFDKF
ncbi:hypothetical protein JJB09_11315 [Rhizobium sp. KVB221]|uniref:Uncharacterized protein n=1 Tax=Rhizobium setariae TaxID=2801340 RepID=A0A936YPU2_9HYPH|nr:hypothetical protein [Rhizobium setariae]MBL0372617.1 hypothetical protein [Rhizobium setariae]